jgi:hypothetical protein
MQRWQGSPGTWRAIASWPGGGRCNWCSREPFVAALGQDLAALGQDLICQLLSGLVCVGSLAAAGGLAWWEGSSHKKGRDARTCPRQSQSLDGKVPPPRAVALAHVKPCAAHYRPPPMSEATAARLRADCQFIPD